MKLTRSQKRTRIHHRVRKKISGTSARPRLSVYRSNRSIYCQIIDDTKNITLISASSHDDSISATTTKAEQSKAVGKLVAERALAANIEAVVFDRGGYLYHGRVSALAEGAREGGLKF